MGAVDLEQIFRTHQKEIYVYFLRTVGDPYLAEDLAQDTYLRACDSALLFRGDASVRTWLFAIARRTLADHFRRNAPEALAEPPERVRVADPGARLAIEEALGRLPILSREAIVLCDVLQLTANEAAEVAETTPNAFRVRLHRARQQFREVYGER